MIKENGDVYNYRSEELNANGNILKKLTNADSSKVVL